jgi:ComF family protein
MKVWMCAFMAAPKPISAPDSIFRRLWNEVFDLVFPPRCAGCGRVDALWCERCLRDLETLPITLHQSTFREETGVQGAVVSTGAHEGRLQEAVQALKYHNTPLLGNPLGDRLAAALDALGWSPDLIVPVPLHESRRRERGYNQAGLLAERLAARIGAPLESTALRRERVTRSQVGLNRSERLQNVVDAFEAEPFLVRGRDVLLVDDVFTTGATLSACALSVVQAGAQAVSALTVSAALV